MTDLDTDNLTPEICRQLVEDDFIKNCIKLSKMVGENKLNSHGAKEVYLEMHTQYKKKLGLIDQAERDPVLRRALFDLP